MTRIFKCRSRCNIIQTRLKGDKGENTSWSQKAVPPPGTPRVCACAVRAARSAPRPHPAPRPDDRSLLTLGLKAKVPRECPRGTGLCGGVTRARPRPQGRARAWRGSASVAPPCGTSAHSMEEALGDTAFHRRAGDGPGSLPLWPGPSRWHQRMCRFPSAHALAPFLDPAARALTLFLHFASPKAGAEASRPALPGV